MSREDALGWLRGENSMCNHIPVEPFETWEVRVTAADTSMIERAYWVLRAMADGFVTEGAVDVE